MDYEDMSLLARSLIKSTELTRVNMADYLGVSPSAVENYMNGSSVPSSSSLVLLIATCYPNFAKEVDRRVAHARKEKQMLQGLSRAAKRKLSLPAFEASQNSFLPKGLPGQGAVTSGRALVMDYVALDAARSALEISAGELFPYIQVILIATGLLASLFMGAFE